MKSKLILGLLLLGGLPFLNSCKDDDDPEPPSVLVGTWDLDLYQLTEFPVGFEGYEGITTPSIYMDESYTLTFTNDKKYSRKITFTGPDLNDTGVWIHEGTDLTLDSDSEDIDDEEFAVEGDITANQLVLSQVLTFNLLPDAVQDTISDEWIEDNIEEYESLLQPIPVKVLFLFEK
jgi:hypothetical protein